MHFQRSDPSFWYQTGKEIDLDRIFVFLQHKRQKGGGLNIQPAANSVAVNPGQDVAEFLTPQTMNVHQPLTHMEDVTEFLTPPPTLNVHHPLTHMEDVTEFLTPPPNLECASSTHTYGRCDRVPYSPPQP